MFANSYFGIILSFIVFEASKKLNKRINNVILKAIFNPLLLSIVTISAILSLAGISYADYNMGGSIISFFIGPATVALVVSLYENIDILKENFKAIMIGIIGGSFISMLLTVILAKIFGVEFVMTVTLLPKSVTTAIAIGLSEEYGGIVALSAIAVIIRGIVGIIIAPIIIKVFKITDPVAQGVGIGTVAHALGTTKARDMGEVQGAMSGLSIAVAGIVTVILMPLMVFVTNIIS